MKSEKNDGACTINKYLEGMSNISYCDFGLDNIIEKDSINTSMFFNDIAYNHIINSKYDSYVSEILLEMKNSQFINEIKSDGVILFVTSLCALKYLLKYTFEIFMCRSLNHKVMDDKNYCKIEDLYSINYNKLLYIISDNLSSKLNKHYKNKPTKLIESYINTSKIILRKLYTELYKDVNSTDIELRRSSYNDVYKFTNILFNVISEITEINVWLIIELHKHAHCKTEHPIFYVNDRLIKMYYDDNYDYINDFLKSNKINSNEIVLKNLLADKLNGHYKIFIDHLQDKHNLKIVKK